VERVLFAPRQHATPRPDVAEDPGPYSLWVGEREVERTKRLGGPGVLRRLDIVMPVTGEPTPELVHTLGSLQQQSADSWTLTVVIEEGRNAEFTSLLAVSGLRQSAKRVTVLVAPVASPVLQKFELALNSFDQPANVALLFPGDVWAADAVAQLAGHLTPGSMVYADEDFAVGDSHADPRLKPDFSPEFLLHFAYIGRPMAMSAEVVAHLPAAGTQDEHLFEHDLSIRAAEVAGSVGHVAEVLCHRHLQPSTTPRLGTDHVAAALTRRGEHGDVTPSDHPGVYRIHRVAKESPSATIIIAFRDAPRLLRTCLDSIGQTAGGAELEFVLIDNGSEEPETLTLVERLAERSDVKVLHDPRPFNWAQLNNLGARHASGDVLIFLNNDIEAQRDGWIRALCAQAVLPDVAVAGARLLYPNRQVQHCGVVIGLGGAAGHVLVGTAEECPGFLNMAVSTRECAAVTGACFATRRAVFDEFNGFDESLGVDLNDIDFCLRAQRVGMRVVFEPAAELIHHESPSRGTAGDVRDIVRFIDRWETSILTGDPYLHPAITRMDGSCTLRAVDEEGWWRSWRNNLARPA
jgi:GT2 family glycosyltransferase